MNPRVTQVLTDLQRQIYEQTRQRTDVHYKEGYGAIFVPEGMPLHPNNVITVIDDMMIVGPWR